jgi:hypothetical protein
VDERRDEIMRRLAEILQGPPPRFEPAGEDAEEPDPMDARLFGLLAGAAGEGPTVVTGGQPGGVEALRAMLEAAQRRFEAERAEAPPDGSEEPAGGGDP